MIVQQPVSNQVLYTVYHATCVLFLLEIYDLSMDTDTCRAVRRRVRHVWPSSLCIASSERSAYQIEAKHLSLKPMILEFPNKVALKKASLCQSV